MSILAPGDEATGTSCRRPAPPELRAAHVSPGEKTGSCVPTGSSTPVPALMLPPIFSSTASPEITRGDRDSVARHLPLLLDLSLSAWLADDADYPDDLPAGHGVVTCREIRGCVLAGVRDVLLPGFAHVGIDVTLGTRFFEERCCASYGELI